MIKLLLNKGNVIILKIIIIFKIVYIIYIYKKNVFKVEKHVMNIAQFIETLDLEYSKVWKNTSFETKTNAILFCL